MPQVKIIVTDAARAGMMRCRMFLREKSETAAARAQKAIREQIGSLALFPRKGRPYPRSPANLRELGIRFGKSGYVALYRYEEEENTVYIVGFKHAREEGYKAVQS